MNDILYEIERLIKVIKDINKIERKIKYIKRKNLKKGEYSLAEKIIGFILVLLNIFGILIFFTNSKMFIGIDLVQIFFYSNNIVLTILIIILVVFSSIEITIFMIEYIGFKHIRDEMRIRRWEKKYKYKLEYMKNKKNEQIKFLKSDKIPQDYVNIKMLYFLKYNIKLENLKNGKKIVEAYKYNVIKYLWVNILILRNRGR
ncbi:hypothetical protein SAMN05661008_00095 [Alkalithermobacter thermoalcaliphilus JW-YL-7 = DSM 7308]|uniref:Uncharacterized protein n=1 Tax=Alkalithermobacter thermoalcaliphilus JW-YL-7 = DSM 7308 TaxID=1121328 RepID=A0A150FRV0_CLOPD|nr:hypothetical protein JWYL7_1426 [[Clostridium] paradoxum JW-YL-7 = DSM 7308]SHK36738.1 hypothetical protein SAMN05661008_00095 [[Clostridium] paradoxum JW-YL-7 = DSM 7308]